MKRINVDARTAKTDGFASTIAGEEAMKRTNVDARMAKTDGFASTIAEKEMIKTGVMTPEHTE